MSEFEKEIDAKIKSGEIMEERYKNGCIVSYFVSFKDIVSTFKGWQPPKLLVVVPQLVAVWFEDRMLGSFSAVVASYTFSDGEAITWVHDNGGLDLLCKMKLYGYTVEKEKLYLLKHIEISNRDTTINCYLTHTFTAPFIGHTNLSKGYDMSDVKECHFTQSEIDDMETGSYEQIAVTINEV